MNESNKSYALQVSLVILAVAFATLGCVFFQPVIGNVFSNISPDLSGQSLATPEDVAKVWFEALFRLDAQTLRDNTCNAQRDDITNELILSLESSLSALGEINTDKITYTYDEASSTVILGGSIIASVDDISLDIPASSLFPSFPVVKEEGRWFICAILEQ